MITVAKQYADDSLKKLDLKAEKEKLVKQYMAETPGAAASQPAKKRPAAASQLTKKRPAAASRPWGTPVLGEQRAGLGRIQEA